jgi:hypothetical protein
MTDSPRDQRHYEPTLDDLQREFPYWHVWHGVNHLWYARLPKTSPPIIARGEGSLELQNNILLIMGGGCKPWLVRNNQT